MYIVYNLYFYCMFDLKVLAIYENDRRIDVDRKVKVVAINQVHRRRKMTPQDCAD